MKLQKNGEEMQIKATLLVEPRGKARPRVVSKGGKTWAYSPSGTVKTEAFIRESLMVRGYQFDSGIPLKLRATFYKEKPKSTPKKIQYPVTRPDLDQYLKLLLDACQKYIFPDDAQITTAIIRKRFGTPPRIELVLEEDNE